MNKYFSVFLGLFFCLSLEAKMAYRPLYDVSFSEASNYFNNIGKTRALNETEKDLQGLLSVAQAMKVEKFQAYSKEPSALDAPTITQGMGAKMQENPKWDLALSGESLKKIEEKKELLMRVFPAQTYGWAWFLNQRGDKPNSKKILMAVYEDGYRTIGQMREMRFGRSTPLTEMEFVRKALEPMSSGKENEALDDKMRKMKAHVSNLPDSNIKT